VSQTKLISTLMQKKVAIIDMGTNTFHLLVGEITDKGVVTLFKDKRPVKIGQGGINQGYITQAAQQRALNTMADFKTIIEEEQVEVVHAIATSAIRNAKNGVELAEKIKKATDIEVRIISGEEEADYIHYGVSKALNIGPETSLIMDIGGGSVEFVICNEQQVFWKDSFEIGAQRLVDLFHQHDPIQPEDIQSMEAYLDEKLAELATFTQKHQPTVLIGSSGTFDTISEIYLISHGIEKDEKATELPITLESYFEIHQELISKNKKERLAIPGMVEMRVEMIVVASCLVNYIIKRYNLKNMRISAYALKEGIMNRIFDALQHGVHLTD
jgi:exopolyphosphatase / guanosine-5'-triphosphate,3'-diphosphate pyrophosphatase